MLLPLHGLGSGTLALLVIAGLLGASTSSASAASSAVQFACASDYFAFCSKYDPDSSAGRNCMSTHGNQLSKRCVNALVRDGEVSKAEVERRSPRSR